MQKNSNFGEIRALNNKINLEKKDQKSKAGYVLAFSIFVFSLILGVGGGLYFNAFGLKTLYVCLTGVICSCSVLVINFVLNAKSKKREKQLKQTRNNLISQLADEEKIQILTELKTENKLAKIRKPKTISVNKINNQEKSF